MHIHSTIVCIKEILQECYNAVQINLKLSDIPYFKECSIQGTRVLVIMIFMETIIITATAESLAQVQELIDAGVDRIYVGEKEYGLRLPRTFSYEELREISHLVHQAGKELVVACNALMHQEMMDHIKPFLEFLEEIKVDYITVGDAGVFYVASDGTK